MLSPLLSLESRVWSLESEEIAFDSRLQTLDSRLLLPLVKRRLDYLGGDGAASNVYLKLLAFVGVFCGHVGEADVLLQIWRGAAGGDAALALAVNQHVLVIARDPALCHLEADEAATDALLLLFSQAPAPGDVALVQYE